MNSRRALAGTAAVVLAALSLSACGFNSQTEQIYNQSRGVDDRSGSVDVLNALIVADDEGRGALVTTLVNNDTENADALRGVAGAGDDAQLQVTPAEETEIPADGLLNLAESPIEVSGERIVPGNFVEITFTFDRSEATGIDVPVMSADDPEYDDVQLPTPTDAASPSVSETPAPE